MAKVQEQSGNSDSFEVKVFKAGPLDDPIEVAAEARGDVYIEPIPSRPSDSADKDKWVEYCVALGAEERYLTEATTHVVDTDAREAVEIRAFTKDEMIDLANRLGG